MPKPPARPPFLPALAGYRALAAMAVLTGHAAAWVTPLPATPAYQPFGRMIHLGLSAFFVLSGFVLQYNYGDRLAAGFRANLGRFAVARFARIYPVYLCFLLAALLAGGRFGFSPSSGGPANLAAFITLTQSWFFTPLTPSIFPLAWAVSVEVFFYGLFPLAALGLARIASAGEALLAGAACLAVGAALDAFVAAHWPGVFALAVSFHPVGAAAPEFFAGQLYEWLTYACPYARVFEFLCGMAAARLFVLRPRPVPGLGLAAGLMLAALVFVPIPEGAFFLGILENNILYAPCLAAICLAVAAAPPAWLCGRTLARLGAASLSVYLIQSFTLPIWQRLFMPASVLASVPAWAALAAAGILATVLAGLLAYRFLEHPLGNFVLARLSPRR